MNTKSLLFSAVLLTLAFASCSKDDSNVTRFTAIMERPSAQSSDKTYLDNDYIKWESDDVVKIFDATAVGADFAVTPYSGDLAKASLVNSEGVGQGPYTAIYPAGLASSTTQLILPVSQFSTDGNLMHLPMYATSNDTRLEFKNLCGALRIYLQESNVQVSRIEVTASNVINGTFNIDASGSEPAISYNSWWPNDGTHTTTLYCLDNPDITNGHYFFVYLPAGVYSSIEIKIYKPTGWWCTKNSTDNTSISGITVRRSQYTNIGFRSFPPFNPPIIPEGAIGGPISVSANQQVYFSKGNLQWSSEGTHQVLGGGTVPGTWRFAEHQYDFVGGPCTDSPVSYVGNVSGSNNENIVNVNDATAPYSGWIDLFGWGTSGYHDANDEGNLYYNPYSYASAFIGDAPINASQRIYNSNWYGYGPSEQYDANDQLSPSHLTGDFASYDWGVYNGISNGGGTPNQWRTLTTTEMTYMLNNRIRGTQTALMDGTQLKFLEVVLHFTNASNDYIYGTIVFPDVFNWPDGYIERPNINKLNNPIGSFDEAIILNAEQYMILERLGCVFLPAAGMREGGQYHFEFMDPDGYYWTSSASNNVNAHNFIFKATNTTMSNNPYQRYRGQSVRLVRNYTPSAK